MPSAPEVLRPVKTAKPARPVRPPKPGKPGKPSKPPKLGKPGKKQKVRAPLKAAKVSKSPKLRRAPKADTRFARAAKREAKRFTGYSRRRRGILIAIFGSFGALLALVAATMFTPILAVENIRVTGVDRLDAKAINSALKSQIGTPLPMVSTESIAKALRPFSLIESFSVISSPPHTLRVAITERQPICIVKVGGTNYLFDPAGIQIGKATDKSPYPKLEITGVPRGSREFEAAIDVLLALPADLLSKVATVDAKTKDEVVLRLRGAAGQRIIWGDGTQSVLKSKVLAALIKNQKKGDYVTFDVSSPTTPVVQYGNF